MITLLKVILVLEIFLGRNFRQQTIVSAKFMDCWLSRPPAIDLTTISSKTSIPNRLCGGERPPIANINSSYLLQKPADTASKQIESGIKMDGETAITTATAHFRDWASSFLMRIRVDTPGRSLFSGKKLK